LKFIKASNDALWAIAIRTTGTTGYGVKQTASAGADTTIPTQLGTMCAQVAAPSQYGYYVPDLLMVTPEAWWDALITTAGHPEVTNGVNGYQAGYGALNVVFINGSSLGTVASNRLTNAVSVVACKNCAFGISRKNWLKIENYSDPVKDLSGAVITGKQSMAELSCAAIGVLTET
jgi:hypothetical protein